MGKQMKLGFGGIESADSPFKARLEPGVHEITIKSVSVEENKNGKEYIAIKCENLTGTKEHEEKMFISTEKGKETTLGRIKHLVNKTIGKDLTGETTIAAIDKALKNKKVRVKFTGEEYEHNGDVKTSTSFAFMGFAEDINVESENSVLKFISTNKYDMKRLEKVNKEAVDYSSEDALDPIEGDDIF